jgi:hypothetical protein
MLEYLRSVFAVTKLVCVIETLIDNLHVDGPSAAFYPIGRHNNDASNNWQQLGARPCGRIWDG